jgi:hypothetical protein
MLYFLIFSLQEKHFRITDQHMGGVSNSLSQSEEGQEKQRGLPSKCKQPEIKIVWSAVILKQEDFYTFQRRDYMLIVIVHRLS